MTTFNPESGDILSQLKTFKTLCAAFSAQVRKLVHELNGEYGLCKKGARKLFWYGIFVNKKFLILKFYFATFCIF